MRVHRVNRTDQLKRTILLSELLLIKIHRIDDTTLNRLQTIANVWQRAVLHRFKRVGRIPLGQRPEAIGATLIKMSQSGDITLIDISATQVIINLAGTLEKLFELVVNSSHKIQPFST